MKRVGPGGDWDGQAAEDCVVDERGEVRVGHLTVQHPWRAIPSWRIKGGPQIEEDSRITSGGEVYTDIVHVNRGDITPKNVHANATSKAVYH